MSTVKEPRTVGVSARIPAGLGEILNRVSKAEERSKSYYVRKGLELFLMKKLEDIEDYEEGMRAYEEFLASGEEAIPWTEVKKELNLRRPDVENKADEEAAT